MQILKCEVHTQHIYSLSMILNLNEFVDSNSSTPKLEPNSQFKHNKVTDMLRRLTCCSIRDLSAIISFISST